jgi:flagellar hook assembly protein FlgD
VKATELFQNYPNPFNPSTQIQFELGRTEAVRLEIFNILGQKVKTMLRGEEFSAGPYTFIWNGRDDNNVQVSSGTYFYKLSTPSFTKTLKMSLVK